MKYRLILIVLPFLMLCACNKPSPVEQRRQEKYLQDSIALMEQQRTLDYYQTQLDLLSPKVDSLLPRFKYEQKNEKYQDHGYYVILNKRRDMRVLVRDDGKAQVMIYLNGKRIEPTDKRLTAADQETIATAQELSVLMSDIQELEHRIAKTSLEVQKYQRRLEKRAAQ